METSLFCFDKVLFYLKQAFYNVIILLYLVTNAFKNRHSSSLEYIQNYYTIMPFWCFDKVRFYLKTRLLWGYDSTFFVINAFKKRHSSSLEYTFNTIIRQCLFDVLRNEQFYLKTRLLWGYDAALFCNQYIQE